MSRPAPLALAALILFTGVAPSDERAARQQPAVPFSVGTSPPAARPGEQRLRFKVTHAHTRAEARARLQYLFDYWKKRFGVASKWEGDHAVASGTIMGISFTAWVEVTDSSVGGESTDPGFFTRGVAYAYIEKKLKKYMHPNYDEP